VVPGRLAPGQWGLGAEAVEQADAADEGRLEARRGIMVGPVTADQGKVVRPSQLIRSVLPTMGSAARGSRPGRGHGASVTDAEAPAAPPPRS